MIQNSQSIPATFHLADSITNLALEKPTNQSTAYLTEWHSGKAVDGDVSSHRCAHTSIDKPDPWWYVDLERCAYITYIKITNRRLDSE